MSSSLYSHHAWHTDWEFNWQSATCTSPCQEPSLAALAAWVALTSPWVARDATRLCVVGAVALHADQVGICFSAEARANADDMLIRGIQHLHHLGMTLRLCEATLSPAQSRSQVQPHFIITRPQSQPLSESGMEIGVLK